MLNFDKVIAGVFGLIFVYLLFNGNQVAAVTKSLAESGSLLIKTLQARS